MIRHLLLASGLFYALMPIGMTVITPAVSASTSIATDTYQTCDRYNNPKNCLRVKPTTAEVSVTNHATLV